MKTPTQQCCYDCLHFDTEEEEDYTCDVENKVKEVHSTENLKKWLSELRQNNNCKYYDSRHS